MAKEQANDPLFGGVPDNDLGQNGGQQEEESNLPESLRGKTPQEIYEMMNEEHNRVVNQTVTELTQQFGQQQPSQQQQQQPRIPKAPPYRPRQEEEEPPDLNYDPDGFMEYQFNKRLTPILQQQVEIARGQNRNFFQSKIGDEEWKKYGPEIEQFVDNLHPQIQAHPEIYQRAYDLARSSHYDENIEEESNKRSLGTVTKVLASMGYTPEQVTDILKSVANGTPLEKLTQQSNDAVQQNARQGLFQPNTGVKPMVDPLKTSVQSAYPKTGPTKKKERHPDAQAVMEAFGMDEKEYSQYEDMNTDLVSQINKGELT